MMKLQTTLVLLVWIFVSSCSGKTAAEWKSRVIYQLLTDRFSQTNADPNEPKCQELRSWCNGTWKGIIRHLDYLQNLGVDAIWISPFVENTAGGYHGYWAKNLLQVNEHFGSKEDLLELIGACHEKNIWVMADVVPNHMGYAKNCSYASCPTEYRNNFQELVPFNDSFHYHEYCDIIWNGPQVNQTELENCRLAYLPDLNQSVPYVRNTLYDWIKNTTMEYKFDGYRVDTVRHIEIGFWPEYQRSAGVYCVGEVWESNDLTYLANYQKNGLDAVLNFHLQGTLYKVFQENATMTLLNGSIHDERLAFKDVQALGTFIDNHDMARFLNKVTDRVLFRNALTYIFFGQGIPIIYYGSEQGFSGGGDPDCRESLWPYYNTSHELYQFIKKNLDFRRSHLSTVVGSTQTELYVDNDTLAFAKENNQLIVVVTNVGSQISKSKTIPVSGQADGTEYENVHDSGDVVMVASGQLTFNINNGHPKVYFIREKSPKNAGSSQHCLSAFLFATIWLTEINQQILLILLFAFCLPFVARQYIIHCDHSASAAAVSA